MFGESEYIPRRDIPQFLKDTISNRSPAGAPSKVVLVGFSIAVELDILEKIGINLRDRELYSIEGILEIRTLSRGIIGPIFPRGLPSLGKVLDYLRIPFQKSHLPNAGNDAHFTLRALLMLAATAFQKMELEDTLKARVSELKSIALDPIDFDSLTPDQEISLAAHNARKAAGRECRRLNPNPGAMKLAVDHWRGGFEEECQGSRSGDSFCELHPFMNMYN